MQAELHHAADVAKRERMQRLAAEEALEAAAVEAELHRSGDFKVGKSEP